jgi:starch phosphorylase
LSALISRTLKIDKSVWLKDLTRLEGLLAHVDDEAFQTEWAEVKQHNKERLAYYVETTLGSEN